MGKKGRNPPPVLPPLVVVEADLESAIVYVGHICYVVVVSHLDLSSIFHIKSCGIIFIVSL